MSPAEAAGAAAAAKLVNDVQLDIAKTRTQRALLIQTLGPDAGTLRANALGLAMTALCIAAGLGPLTFIGGAVTSSITGNIVWFLPLAGVIVAVAVLLGLSRRLTTRASRLTEERLGLAPRSLPKWPLLKAIPLPKAATSVNP